MRRCVALLFLALLAASAATAADAAACAVRKGLYESWLGLAKRSSPRTGVAQDSLVREGTANRGAVDASGPTEIGREYNGFFQCLSDLAQREDGKDAMESSCQEVGFDPMAWMVCRLAVYLKGGRTATKDFLDALPVGKKSAQLIWDLEAITSKKPPEGTKMFPKGPSYQLLDELFLLVLDDKETAAARFFYFWSVASPTADRYMGAQVQTLLRDSPAVVVKEWPVLRNYRTQLKKVIAEMAASLPAAEMSRMRQGLTGFCTPDNLDCPELMRTFGKPQ